MATKLNNPYPDKNKNDWNDEKEYLSNGKLPVREPRSKRVWMRLRPFLAFIISIAIIACVVFGVFNYVKGHYFDPVDPNDMSAVEVTIPKGSSLNKISEILYESNLIRDKQVFKLYTDFSDMGGKLKAGTYTLSKNMTFDDIIYSLQEGNVEAEQIDTTFIEGRTAEEYAKKLVDDYAILKNTTHYMEVVTTGGDFIEQYPFLAEAKARDDARPEGQKRRYLLEGYLFPETYKNFTDATEEDVIKKQLDQFKKVFKDEYVARAQELNMSIDEIVTLASIIEKEASRKEDFKKVAAVFYNRLHSEEEFAQFLDSDATQAYGLGISGRLSLYDDELTTSTPYNTKRNGVGYPGLPAGPIGNPGKDAIEAALYPDQDLMKEGKEYYYFLATDPKTGEMAFTQGIDEFNEIKAQWQDAWAQADAEAAAKAAQGQ